MIPPSARPPHSHPVITFLAALTIASLTLAMPPLAAQNPAAADSAAPAAMREGRAPARDTTPAGVFELREVVVSAARPVSQAAATVHVIEGARLRALGARTLDQALALVPGAGVRTGGEGVPRVDFRGFRPRHLLVLLDGVPLNSTFDGQPDLSLIPVDRIAYVKLIGGTASVLYGEALGGIVEVVTREPGPGVSGAASLEARSGRGRAGRAELGGGTDAVRVFTTVTASTAAGFPAPIPGGAEALRQNSGRDWSTGFGSATLTGRHARLGLIVTGGAGHYGIPPIEIDDPTDPFASRATYERVEHLAGAAGQLSFAWLAARTLSLRGWAFGNGQDERSARYDDSTYSAMSDSTVKGTYRQTARTRLAGGGLQAAWSPSARSRLTLGLTGERDAWSADGAVRDVPITSGSGSGGGGGNGGASTTWGIRSLADSRVLARFGAALEWEITPLPALGFSLGAARHVLVRDSADGEAGDALVAGGRWRAPGGVRVRASAARRFRFPTIRQFYDVDGGSPALSPERATELELGAERALTAHATVGLALFRADVRGYIDRPASGQPFANRGLLRFQGVEGTVAIQPARALALNASLSYLRTADRSPGANDEELQYTPRLRALLDARWHPDAATTVAGNIARVEHQVYYSRQAPVRSARLPDYTLVAARLARRLPGGRAEAYVGGENLLNAEYQDQYGFPRPARTIYAGLSASW